MSFNRFAKTTVASIACAFAVGGASAAIVSISKSSVSIGNHSTNLVVNGSFETRAPADPPITTNVYWSGVDLQHSVSPAGSASGAVYSIPGWGQTSSPGAYGQWGTVANMGTNAPACSDGTACLYFGNWQMSTGVANPAIFHPDGTVTYATPPIFTNSNANNAAPTVLFQTLNGLISGGTYFLEFWVAGEESNVFSQQPGVFGLGIGSDSVLLTVPTLTSLLSASNIRYGVTFTANSTSEVLKFTNWGHIRPSPNYYGSELILDDVIVNRVPEPGTFALTTFAVFMLLAQRKRIGKRD